MLLIQVGTQNISPLAWSIESGALEAARTMIGDLLTFRADRDKYYYAADELFQRHPTIVQMLLNDGPALLPELLSGLVWRSRLTFGGMRRVNYFIRHLLIDQDGKFAKTMEWISKAKDPKIVCHPVLVVLSDVVWSRVARRSFLVRSSWFIFTLIIFILCQSILEHTGGTGDKPEVTRFSMFFLRVFIYMCSMGGMIMSHSKRIMRAYLLGDTVRVWKLRFPTYLNNWQEIASFTLMFLLILMLSTEPVLYCLADNHGYVFTDRCDASRDFKFINSVISMLSMILYYTLLIDLAVFNNRVSAYVLVVGRMLSELGLFLIALVVMTLTFSSSLSCLDQKIKRFYGIHEGSLALFEMVMQIFTSEGFREMHDQPVVLISCFFYLILTVIFLLNLLVAQLSCAYNAVYADMVGYARLKRVRIIVETMPQVSGRRWNLFVNSLEFEKRIEFNEGDVGLANGVASSEIASSNPTSIDIIKRFGGSTAPSIQWPDEEGVADEADRFERLENLIKKAMERFKKNSGGGGGGGSKTGSGTRSGTHESGGSGGKSGGGSDAEET